MASQMDAFLEECSRSGDAAYAALKALLERLENPATRTEARVFLADVQRRFYSKEDADRCSSGTITYFLIHDVVLNDFEGGTRRQQTFFEQKLDLQESIDLSYLNDAGTG